MLSGYFPPTIQLSLSTKNASLADSGPVFIGFLCGVASSDSKQKTHKKNKKTEGGKRRKEEEWNGWDYALLQDNRC